MNERMNEVPGFLVNLIICLFFFLFFLFLVNVGRFRQSADAVLRRHGRVRRLFQRRLAGVVRQRRLQVSEHSQEKEKNNNNKKRVV